MFGVSLKDRRGEGGGGAKRKQSDKAVFRVTWVIKTALFFSSLCVRVDSSLYGINEVRDSAD